ncbi:carbon catabolite repressor protein 4 homolog 6-like isoform X2 [Benincasa hispida]|uniref:carbon catabolite repressor protein 4 homolog 6-like isoform X2 n=1 Tax=Benincasa hispida TaxID=102211 RepID=UPI0018FF2198|nr:carbon catabolite repressor protein 4 homolog 6-like isoform X2 [Benincasa hispida]
MRRAATPPPPLHQLSVAVATATATATATTATNTSAVMSSRPPYRGGRYGGHRGFSSERPYSGGRGQFVTGDSHFQSVRESNLGFQRGERGGFANNAGRYSATQNPRPPSFGGNHQFRQAPPSTQRHQYRGPHPHTHCQQPPSFNQNQGVHMPQQIRPRPPKPLDYRHWDYAKTPPPSTCERFSILSYNILADYLAMDHKQKLYRHIPGYMLDWEWRKNHILFELGLWSTDIMCFQEVDRFHDLEEALKVRGFSGIWKMRTGTPVDGCAIFWHMSRFKLLHEESIEFNKLGLRDNVAQICVLESHRDDGDNSVTPPISTSNHNKVVICNIHVLYNPKRGEIKLGQVRVLLEKAHAISKNWDNAPIVLCGDFNCTPKSALYNFISEQKLDLSGLDRDKVSGQSSAEIHQPSSFWRNPRLQTANGSVPLQSRSESSDIERKSDSSLSDIQKQDCSRSCMENENLPSVNHILPPDSSHIVFDAPDTSCNDLQLGMKGTTLHSEGKKESQRSALFDHKNGGETTCCEKTDSFNENSITCAKDEFTVGHTSKKVGELVSPLGTDPELVHLNETERRQMEKTDASHLINKSSTDGYEDHNFGKESKDTVDPLILDDAQLYSQTVCWDSKNVSSTPACKNSMAETAIDSSDVVTFDRSFGEFEKESSSGRNIEGGPSTGLPGIDSDMDERPKIFPSDEQDVAALNGSLTEDDQTFLSALHGVEDPFSSDIHHSGIHRNLVPPPTGVEDDLLPGLNTKSFEVENVTHDRSLWTPMEIETATGNADITLIEHSLRLRSTYTEAEDLSGTRDLNGEPLATSYNRCFLGTVDYIWRSEGLQTVRVLAPIRKQVMQQLTPGFPTKKWGSDHIALATELAFVRSREE